ncbi:MAG: metallophosphoesterase [Methanomassiliicoccales archaeon]|nr:metallophosphoesterase [Methanomassiliicoccales archaeon]
MRDQGLVAFADLHIGYEAALEEEGLHLPRLQTATMREGIVRILEKYDPETVLIVGDLKHEFSKNLGQEWSDVKSILDLLRENAKVLLVRGNHDNYLKNIASKMKIRLVDKARIGGLTFLHGHTECAARPLVIAHEHPSVKIVDRVGAAIRLPAFVHFRDDEVLVLPAFSPLAAGTDVTRAATSDFLSPILTGCDVSATSVYGCSEIGILNLGSIPMLGGFRI